ncbi:MAG: GLPGLI family protein [Candidatus Symbiothrix sp.]|jgi:GLPGLI family protein|nr:GLPGLI family protein [Candidatus Symbiothrix sp.]
MKKMFLLIAGILPIGLFSQVRIQIVTTFFFLLGLSPVFAQFTVVSSGQMPENLPVDPAVMAAMAANGTIEELEEKSLDMATVRAYYRFIQKEKASDKSAFRNDMMTLDIGPQMSHYYDETKPAKDSIAGAIFKTMNPAMISSISVIKDGSASAESLIGDRYENNYYDGAFEKIYKNRLNGEIIIIDMNYKCDDAVGSFNWEISPDTATIFDYSCQKATTRFRGRNYEAWFTLEVPINDGPWKFYGLPGLIVKIKDSQGLIDFECVGLQYLDHAYAIEIPKGKYISCSRKDLEKIVINRGASLSYVINGGNIVLLGKPLSPSFKFLELE